MGRGRMPEGEAITKGSVRMGDPGCLLAQGCCMSWTTRHEVGRPSA